MELKNGTGFSLPHSKLRDLLECLCLQRKIRDGSKCSPESTFLDTIEQSLKDDHTMLQRQVQPKSESEMRKGVFVF